MAETEQHEMVFCVLSQLFCLTGDKTKMLLLNSPSVLQLPPATSLPYLVEGEAVDNVDHV